ASALPTVSSLTWPGWYTATYNVYEAFVPRSLPVLVLLLKVPMVVSAALTGLLLKKMTGDGANAVWWLANPLVILVASIWGQLDPIATLFGVASIDYFERRKMYHAYLFASLGAAIKVWPVLLIPFYLIITVKEGGLKALKPTSAILPVLGATIGIYSA